MNASDRSPSFGSNLAGDLSAGLVVFLVALPLCLGVALASNGPLFSGLVAGIVGGVVVGILSGSHTSVSGPAAWLAAVVAAHRLGAAARGEGVGGRVVRVVVVHRRAGGEAEGDGEEHLGAGVSLRHGALFFSQAMTSLNAPEAK